MLDILQNWDTALFLALNGLAPAWDAFFWWVSVPWTWTPLYMLLVLAVCRRFPTRRSRLWVAMAVGLCLTGTDVVSARVLKPSVARLRPSHEPSLEEAIHLVEERPGKWYQGGSYGFVSSHAANHRHRPAAAAAVAARHQQAAASACTSRRSRRHAQRAAISAAPAGADADAHGTALATRRRSALD